MDALRQWLNSKTNQVGILAGLIGLLFSFAGRSLNLGRELGDPLPVALSFSQALRGSLLYLNWRGVVWHLLFILFLVVLVVGIVRFWLPLTQRQEILLGTAARVAAVLNVTAVAITEIDAIVVAFWYGMAGFISVFVTGLVAEGVAKLINWQNDESVRG